MQKEKKNRVFYWLKQWKEQPQGIQTLIMISFSLIAVLLLMLLGVIIYLRFTSFFLDRKVQDNQMLMEQTTEKMEDYLQNMRRISDTIYYDIVKEKNIAEDKEEIVNGMNLIYEANRDNLKSIAVYNTAGSLLLSEPVISQKEDPNITKQGWFLSALSGMENMHFSTPHIENLFDDGTMQYYWVVSLSRMVELTDKGETLFGVLLVDMDYSAISRMMKQINTSKDGQYYYLCDKDGEILYHPRELQITHGIGKENNLETAKKSDGVYEEEFDGQSRKVIVDTVSYTGWKLVGILPQDTLTHGMLDMKYFVASLIVILAMTLFAVNRIVAVKISKPLQELNQSVIEYESGKNTRIYRGGSVEVCHLSDSIEASYEKIDLLMKENVRKEREKRKSELDALQSQINPHFLYNTLESIMWMVEGERNEEASFMISELAKLFRISLSKGHTVISLKDELQHAKSYMNLQKIRYKNTFSVMFEVPEELGSYCTSKLILQPILENAIQYGVQEMEECGEIYVYGRLEEGNLILTVKDNGLGMTKEEAENVLTDTDRVHKKGSGVGLCNVNNRIKLLFEGDFGIKVESEPDEGTTITIVQPAVAFTEENRKALENGTYQRAEEKKELNQKEEKEEVQDE